MKSFSLSSNGKCQKKMTKKGERKKRNKHRGDDIRLNRRNYLILKQISILLVSISLSLSVYLFRSRCLFPCSVFDGPLFWWYAKLVMQCLFLRATGKTSKNAINAITHGHTHMPYANTWEISPAFVHTYTYNIRNLSTSLPNSSSSLTHTILLTYIYEYFGFTHSFLPFHTNIHVLYIIQ